MTEAKANVNTNESVNYNKNAIIIAATIVVLAIIFMLFWDKQQQRELESERLEMQTNVWEEWGLPQQNRRTNNVPGKGQGKIL